MKRLRAGERMDRIGIELCESLPPRVDLDGFLGQYCAEIVGRMEAMGLAIDPEARRSALEEFWARAVDDLPPKGCLVLARDAGGQVVGCGMLKCLGLGTGELKRLFVMPEARGMGTGRRASRRQAGWG